MTIPYTRLLLATEHTEFDTGAEAVAVELARERGVPLAGVVPIVSNDEYESVASELVARVEEGVHARLVALRADAARAGVDLEVRVRRGEEPWREIVAEAKERNADLLVIRRRGKRSFLANLMVGEMVGKVATHAPCSALLVPRAARLWTRRVLAAVTKDAPLEFALARDKAMCCGAGGGRMWMEEHTGKRINVLRAEQALERSPKAIATACPYCAIMLRDGIAELGRGDDIPTKDIAEIVADAL